jgi:hypothetical protein
LDECEEVRREDMFVESEEKEIVIQVNSLNRSIMKKGFKIRK